MPRIYRKDGIKRDRYTFSLDPGVVEAFVQKNSDNASARLERLMGADLGVNSRLPEINGRIGKLEAELAALQVERERLAAKDLDLDVRIVPWRDYWLSKRDNKQWMDTQAKLWLKQSADQLGIDVDALREKLGEVG